MANEKAPLRDGSGAWFLGAVDGVVIWHFLSWVWASA